MSVQAVKPQTGYVDYSGVMRAIAVACKKNAIFGRRHFTRTYQDFALYAPEDLSKGVATLMSAGISEYPYEQGATEVGRHRIVVIVQGRIDGDTTGEDVEEAEFLAIRQLEILSVECQEIEILSGYKMISIATSGQLERPYYWAAAEITNYVEGTESE